MQDRYDDPTRISRHHAEQDIMVRQWLLHIPWMKKYAESSSLNNKVTRKDEDRDQDGLTIMILRPPKCETVSGQYWQSVKMMNVKLTNLARRDKWRMSSQTDLEKWWMSNRPKSGIWKSGTMVNVKIWDNGECLGPVHWLRHCYHKVWLQKNMMLIPCHQGLILKIQWITLSLNQVSEHFSAKFCPRIKSEKRAFGQISLFPLELDPLTYTKDLQMAKFRKSITGHNFWLECRTDLRSTPLSCIFDALFRDTPLAFLTRHLTHDKRDIRDMTYVTLHTSEYTIVPRTVIFYIGFSHNVSDKKYIPRFQFCQLLNLICMIEEDVGIPILKFFLWFNNHDGDTLTGEDWKNANFQTKERIAMKLDLHH